MAKELAVFGFTLNQAKVYLTIVRAGPISVGKIAESSKVYRQDIYKILPKLEKMGVITRTIDEPITILAIPTENALNNIITNEKKKATERITHMEAIVKELTSAVREQQEKPKTPEEPRKFILLSTDAEIKSMADFSFENARIGCDMVLSLELLERRKLRFRDRFQTLAKHKARTRLIIETPNNEDLAERVVEEIRPHDGNFEAKLIRKEKPIPYHILDHEEAWISRNEKTNSGFPMVLWTNSRNIIQFREENFEEAWNSPAAINIHPKKGPARRKLAKGQKAISIDLLST